MLSRNEEAGSSMEVVYIDYCQSGDRTSRIRQIHYSMEFTAGKWAGYAVPGWLFNVLHPSQCIP